MLLFLLLFSRHLPDLIHLWRASMTLQGNPRDSRESNFHNWVCQWWSFLDHSCKPSGGFAGLPHHHVIYIVISNHNRYWLLASYVINSFVCQRAQEKKKWSHGFCPHSSTFPCEPAKKTHPIQAGAEVGTFESFTFLWPGSAKVWSPTWKSCWRGRTARRERQHAIWGVFCVANPFPTYTELRVYPLSWSIPFLGLSEIRLDQSKTSH